VAGPRQPLAGLVSRKSELVEVKRLKTVIESQIAEALRAIDASVARIGEAETQARHLARKRDQETQTRDQTRICMAQAGDLLVRLAEEEQSLADQSGVLTTQAQSAREGLSVIRARLEEIESRLSELDSTLAETTRRVESLEAERALVQGRSTSARVELAKSDQRLEHLLAQVRQLHRDQEERQRVVEEEERHLVEANGRLAASEGAILAAESALAMAYLEKERLSAETTRLASDRDQARTARADLVGRYHALSGEVRAILEEQHQLELVVHQVRLERKTLEDRFREDYQADLARLAVLPPAEGAASREEVSAEIDELRRKIQQLGNVNLDALDELSEVENRHASLSAQYEDLVRAKGSLDQIIQRINVDSRRLFEETLETIRGHFVVLFRKLFGGGQADILVESGVDILESGVDIVALPPGSPPGNKPRSISLLSGGQKTLTCLALLLAIFKSRPSPFCVLDEVDAHLDEPNIERILGVLAEFASFTQFIVITHRKKTMTCADTLYGVTMQESGVSKPVSVRFEDVSEGGHIERSASAALDARAEEGTQAA
jgi:chromosome segregation protein